MSSTELSGALWRKSNYSNGQANCVEVTALTGERRSVAVRDSKAPDALSLIFTARTWRQFTNSVGATREGRLAIAFDRCCHEACLRTLRPLIRSASRISAHSGHSACPVG
jgi:hypothetical protein